jgi:hypothetical protein
MSVCLSPRLTTTRACDVQILNAAPRDMYTVAQVSAMLVAPDLKVSYGFELLDASLNLVSNISKDVSGGIVHRGNYNDIHGTVDLTISRVLAWGRDRIRPFMLMSSTSAGVTACRWNLGVYLPTTTPDLPLAESPVTYAVTGYDQLHLLQDNIGDSYAVAAGANVLTAVASALTAAGITAPVLLDTTAVASVLSTDLTLPLTSSDSPTWIQVVNRLLAAISYRAIWCDADGAFRSGPYVNPSDAPVEWVFKVGDLRTGIVANDRTVASDLWNKPNWWQFIANGLTVPPVELVPGVSTNNGQYTVNNSSTGLSSQASVGRIVHAPVQFLDAVDDASLMAQGDAIVAADKRSTEVITAKLSPFPAAWHFDVVTYSDAVLGSDRKAQCHSWDLPLDGSDMDYILETI